MQSYCSMRAISAFCKKYSILSKKEHIGGTIVSGINLLKNANSTLLRPSKYERQLRFTTASSGTTTQSTVFKTLPSPTDLEIAFQERIMSGVYPPIPTIFDESGNLSTSKIAENVKNLLTQAGRLSGLCVLGSNGEYPHLSKEEKLLVLNTVRQSDINPEIHLLIAGTGANSTQETIELTNKAASIGYHAALVVTPYYYRAVMSDEAYINHYLKIADNSKIPIILYNVPIFTGSTLQRLSINILTKSTGEDLRESVIEKLAHHPNIIGIKESSGNIVKIASLVQIGNEVIRKGGFFGVFAGSGSYFLPALSVGARGGILALANIFPSDCIQLQDLYNAAQLSKARDLQLALVPVNQAVTKQFGSNWRSGFSTYLMTGIPGLKAAMEMCNFHGGNPRPPLQPLNSQQRAQLTSILQKFREYRAHLSGGKNSTRQSY